MAEHRLRQLAADEPADWPEQLLREAAFTGTDAWANLAESVYGFRSHRFETRADGVVTGLLSLTHVRHPLFGSCLTTAPYGSYGGFAFSGDEPRDQLLARAAELATELRVNHVNVRFVADEAATPPSGWLAHPIYATYRMDLVPDPDAMLARFSSDHRNHVRKSLKKGFSVRFGHLDLLDPAYEALAVSMQELGSPFHGKAYLHRMAELLGDRLELCVMERADGDVAGAGVMVRHGSVVNNLYANILRAHRSDYAGEFLYWKIIERYAGLGFDTFDIGRSLLGSGNDTFKMKWKPQRLPLAYWYALRQGRSLPNLNQANPRFATAIQLWKQMPRCVVRPLGPLLVRGLA